MKLLSAKQIRQWDQYTIENEPVSSLELMERAAAACTKWILQNTIASSYYIFCGKGNNGGDGLAIARLLLMAGKNVTVFILDSTAKGTKDYAANYQHLHQVAVVPIILLKTTTDFPKIPEGCLIIDALFGTGLNRKLESTAAALVHHLNASGNSMIAIDIPSGLFCDGSSLGNTIIKAGHTLTFQCLKTAFLVAENEPFFGQVHIMDINLNLDFMDQVHTPLHLINKPLISKIYKPRNAFAHKGDFGHALLIAGSYGKIGAAVLGTRACLKSGSGLVTTHVPKQSLPILQIMVPEAMAIADPDEHIITQISYNTDPHSAIGIGPGIGTGKKTASLVQNMLTSVKTPLVIDADGLNIISELPELLAAVPPNTILTPHPKEFTRLFGETGTDFEKIDLALAKSKEFNIIIVLKGHHTLVATPGGTGYFNITGNAGMAKGGTGDVLTGIITGLLAQNYEPEQAAIMGVFIHGLAGDHAATLQGMEAMTASDIIENIGEAFKQLY